MIYKRVFTFITALFTILFFGRHPGAYAQSSSQETVMLVLGSANPKTLEHRINIAVRLYNSEVEFKHIIVSGGCGAHGSSICEASKMDSLLKLNGIPGRKIFKEEKSNSTKQNFCYSKKLSRNGIPLIRKTTRLYVVSDHWHAIPVASCFREAEGVMNALFHIEGTINPRGPADYTHIFKNCRTGNYCRSILWAFIDAAYFNKLTNKIYYFVEDIYYRETPGQGIDPGFPKKVNQYPAWPQNWNKRVDAAYFNPEERKVYLFSGTEFIRHTPGEETDPGYPQKISRYFKDWPGNWGGGYIDAAYYSNRNSRLYLFKGNEFLYYTSQGLAAGYPVGIKHSYSENWPFQWGSGSLDAAYYNPNTSGVSLFRGTSYLQHVSGEPVNPEYPEPISLPWPKQLWGERPETH